MQGSCRSAASAALVVLALCFSIACLAQSAPAPAAHTQVNIVHVKPEMLTEWIDLQKNEVVPAQKKAGVKTRTTYQTIFGNTFEYLVLTPLDKYAQRDGQAPAVRALGAEGAARLAAKLRRCLDSSETFISNPLPDLSNAPVGELPELGVFTRVRVATGRMPEYHGFIKNDLLPVYKKGNRRLTVAQRSLGANSNDVTLVAWFSKMADLDGGPTPVRVLGPEGAAKLLAKQAGMATLIQQVVRRRVPDLSY